MVATLAHRTLGQPAHGAHDHAGAFCHLGGMLDIGERRQRPMTRPPSAPTAMRLSVAILRRLTRRLGAKHAGLHHQHQRGAAAERAHRSVVGIEELQGLLQRRRLGQLERIHGPAPGPPAAKAARIFSTKPFSISLAFDLSTG